MTRPELRAALAQAHSALHSGETCDAALHDEITAALRDAEAGAGGGALDALDALDVELVREAVEYSRLAAPVAASYRNPDTGHGVANGGNIPPLVAGGLGGRGRGRAGGPTPGGCAGRA